MDVFEAIQTRKSIRAFKSDPVPKETIKKIPEVSQRAPGGTNTQPWLTYVCATAKSFNPRRVLGGRGNRLRQVI